MEGVFAKVKGQGAVYGLDTDRWDWSHCWWRRVSVCRDDGSMGRWAFVRIQKPSQRGSFSYSDSQDPKNSQSFWDKFTISNWNSLNWGQNVDQSRQGEVKWMLVQVEWSRRDLHEVQCMTFFQQTKIQSDLRDEQSPQGRKWNLNGDQHLLKNWKFLKWEGFLRSFYELGSSRPLAESPKKGNRECD